MSSESSTEKYLDLCQFEVVIFIRFVYALPLSFICLHYPVIFKNIVMFGIRNTHVRNEEHCSENGTWGWISLRMNIITKNWHTVVEKRDNYSSNGHLNSSCLSWRNGVPISDQMKMCLKCSVMGADITWLLLDRTHYFFFQPC